MPDSMWDVLLAACALTLVIEGLLPFLSPTTWRNVFQRALLLSEGQIRFLGLSGMVAGLVTLAFVWP